MSKLSGLVAILNETGDTIVEIKDLGPEPIGVKPGRVLPIEDNIPDLLDGYHLGEVNYTILEDKVIRSWNVEKDELPDLQPYQFFAVLELSGNKEKLYKFVSDLPYKESIVAKARLEHTLTFRRNDDLVNTAKFALGLTDEILDDLWKQALTL